MNRKGRKVEERRCLECGEVFKTYHGSSRKLCGKKECVLARRRGIYGSSARNQIRDYSPGSFALERDPFVFSGMNTGCSYRSWLRPELLPFDWWAGGVWVMRGDDDAEGD